jgi:hypothetical protein
MTAQEMVAGYKHAEDIRSDEYFHNVDFQPVVDNYHFICVFHNKLWRGEGEKNTVLLFFTDMLLVDKGWAWYF